MADIVHFAKKAGIGTWVVLLAYFLVPVSLYAPAGGQINASTVGRALGFCPLSSAPSVVPHNMRESECGNLS